jgi:hypothetical protein
VNDDIFGKGDPFDEPPGEAPRRRKSFNGEWAKLSKHWSDQLRQAQGISTYHLAHAILHEAFKRQYVRGPVVLSAAVTGLPRSSRPRAIRDMLRLQLIKVKWEGRRAAVVTELVVGNGAAVRLED